MESRVEELYKLVTKFCENWNIRDEDILQDLVWTIWQKIDKYDETKGAFSTFVFINCKYIYLTNKLKKKDTISLDQEEGLIEVIPNNESNWYISYIYENVCSPLLRDYLQGYKQKDLAKKYGLVYCTCSWKIRNELQQLKETYGV